MAASLPSIRSISVVPELRIAPSAPVTADDARSAPQAKVHDGRADMGQVAPRSVSTTRVDGLALAAEPHARSVGRDEQIRAFAAGLATAGVVDASAAADFAALVSDLRVSGARDVNDLVQQVLREAYVTTTEDLNFYAQKVAFYNDLKKKIRADISALRKALADNAGEPDDARAGGTKLKYPLNSIDDERFKTLADGTRAPNPNFGKPRYPGAPDAIAGWDSIPGMDDEGRLVATRQKASSLSLWPTKEELSAYIDDLESQLNSVGDDAQLANVDLQNMLQKQQQTLQMMSNISKVLHDTAMAVVRKISG